MSKIDARAGQGPMALLSPEEAIGDPILRHSWDSMMDRVHPIHRFTSSPKFFEHRWHCSRNDEMHLGVMRDEDGLVIGLCPVDSWRLELPFQVRKWFLGKFNLRAATITGGEPLLPPDPALFRQFFDGLIDGLPWCDCIFIPSVPLESPTCKFLYNECRTSSRYFLYPKIVERRAWYTLELGDSLDHFLKGKQKRTRNTLKRRVRKFREHGGGSLDCIRVETEDQVDSFHESAIRIAERSWQYRNLGRRPENTVLSLEKLRDLARAGCLCAYLLTCGDNPAAYIIGYRYEDVLQFEETAYAEEFGNLSPGTVLYFLLLEDLYEHNPPAFIDHGIGIGPHKEVFSNHVSYDTSAYLFRRTARNRARCSLHGSFYAGLRLAKRLMKKTPPGSRDSEAEAEA
jgi:hypothetical protein